MPRDGSQSGAPTSPFGPMNIGDVATPPFAVLPDPVQVFATRAARFRELAAGHELDGYLRLLGAIADAQAAIVPNLPPVALPTPEQLSQAAAHAMPPISLGAFMPDGVSDATFAALLERLAAHPEAGSAKPVIDALLTSDVAARRTMMLAILMDDVPADAVAAHVLAAAAVQVHFARLASSLDAATLKKVANGACPACGGRPVASAIVGWEGAANTRFCTCSLCATQWNAPRVVCLSCGAEKGIAYHGLEGGSDLVKGETCEGCNSYVKILYQIRGPSLEAFADDVATLGLDLKLREEGFARASANPFLIGY